MRAQRTPVRLPPATAAVGVAVELLLAAGLICVCALVAYLLNFIHRG